MNASATIHPSHQPPTKKVLGKPLAKVVRLSDSARSRKPGALPQRRVWIAKASIYRIHQNSCPSLLTVRASKNDAQASRAQSAKLFETLNRVAERAASRLLGRKKRRLKITLNSYPSKEPNHPNTPHLHQQLYE
jgi:hypothetical protein